MTLVLGAGVSGLSSAIRLLEAGHTVELWARDLPPRTTSNIAAAVWYPYKAYPEDLVLGWSAATFAAFTQLEHEPAAGVILREGLELFPNAVDDPWWKTAVPNFRRAQADELPAGYGDGFVFDAHVIEMDRYMPYLLERFRSAGGRLVQRAVASLNETLAEHDLVIDCVGLGARELLGDTQMLPIRGQVVRVAQVGIERFTLDDYSEGGVAYIIPREHDIILGGVAEEGRELLEIEPATATGILERCIRLEPRLRDAAVLEHRVGLRPGRTTIRLERETIAAGKTVIHNYGHGGAGVTLSWGCADEVAALAGA